MWTDASCADRAAHWLRPNEACRYPRRHIFLDTEARIERVPGGHVQTWRLAVARFRTAPKGRRVREREAVYDDPATLWKDIDAHCGRNERTILWAHNLGYDARISQAFEILPHLGWELEAHNLAPRGAWLQWRRGKASLLMVDSAAIFQTRLAKVAEMFGMAKLDIPLWTEDRDLWEQRCRRDVEILATAVTAYLAWLEREGMGNWQMTGAGQSWAAFRHRFMTHKMLVHEDVAALRAERRALWTGRCEAYWHGTWLGETVHEWDLPTAYAHVMRDVAVPTHLVGPMPDGYDWRSVLGSDRVALLAVCTVDTPAPVVPTLLDGRILWPTGRFETVLWDVEIRAALAEGATVTVHNGWLYRKRPALQAFGQWVLDGVAAPDERVPAWEKMIRRHWGHALVGRFAMTYTLWEEVAHLPVVGTRYARCHDLDTGETYDIMQAGRTLWREAGRQDWSQSQPAVTGYIQAVCRVRLWDIMRSMPPRSFLYVDTDSLLVSDSWLSTMEDIATSPVGHGLRLKRSWDGISIYGPRQIVTGDRVRISGVSHYAKRVERHVYDGEVWESLRTGLHRGHASEVRLRDRTWHANGVDRRRTATAVGWTEPIHIGG